MKRKAPGPSPEPVLNRTEAAKANQKAQAHARRIAKGLSARSSDTAEDIAQESLLQLLESSARKRPNSADPTAPIGTIAKRVGYRMLRARYREGASPRTGLAARHASVKTMMEYARREADEQIACFLQRPLAEDERIMLRAIAMAHTDPDEAHETELLLRMMSALADVVEHVAHTQSSMDQLGGPALEEMRDIVYSTWDFWGLHFYDMFFVNEDLGNDRSLDTYATAFRRVATLANKRLSGAPSGQMSRFTWFLDRWDVFHLRRKLEHGEIAALAVAAGIAPQIESEDVELTTSLVFDRLRKYVKKARKTHPFDEEAICLSVLPHEKGSPRRYVDEDFDKPLFPTASLSSRLATRIHQGLHDRFEALAHHFVAGDEAGRNILDIVSEALPTLVPGLPWALRPRVAEEVTECILRNYPLSDHGAYSLDTFGTQAFDTVYGSPKIDQAMGVLQTTMDKLAAEQRAVAEMMKQLTQLTQLTRLTDNADKT